MSFAALNSSPPPRVVCASKAGGAVARGNWIPWFLGQLPRDNGQQKGFWRKVTPLKTYLDHSRLQKSQKGLWRILLRPEVDTYSLHVKESGEEAPRKSLSRLGASPLYFALAAVLCALVLQREFSQTTVCGLHDIEQSRSFFKTLINISRFYGKQVIKQKTLF